MMTMGFLRPARPPRSLCVFCTFRMIDGSGFRSSSRLAKYVERPPCRIRHITLTTSQHSLALQCNGDLSPNDCFVLAQALNERKAEIRVQFKPPVALPGSKAVLDGFRNELVVRLQPDEAIYMKFALKQPGLEMTPIMSELDLTYRVRFATNDGVHCRPVSIVTLSCDSSLVD